MTEHHLETPRISGLVSEVEKSLGEGRSEEAQNLVAQRVRSALLHDGFQHDPVTGPWAVHYTNLAATISILETGGFRLYNTEASSDPSEGSVLRSTAFYRGVSRTYEWLESSDSESHRRPHKAYVLSAISPDRNGANGESLDDDLVWWRLYGDDGRGCSIRLNTPPSDFPMYRVRYTDSGAPAESPSAAPDSDLGYLAAALGVLDMKIGGFLRDSRKSAAHVRDAIENCAYLVKNLHYSAEHEIRALRFSPPVERVQFEMDAGVPVRRFVDGPRLADCFLSGSKITIGPSVRHPEMVRAFLEGRLRAAGCGDTKVRISKVEYGR